MLIPHDNEVDIFLEQPHATELVDIIIFRIGYACYVPGYQYHITLEDSVRSILSYRTNKLIFVPACNMILANQGLLNSFLNIDNNTNQIGLINLFNQVRHQLDNN